MFTPQQVRIGCLPLGGYRGNRGLGAKSSDTEAVLMGSQGADTIPGGSTLAGFIKVAEGRMSHMVDTTSHGSRIKVSCDTV